MKLSESSLQDLELLFQFASAQELRKSVTFLLMQYLMQEHEGQKTPKGLYENLFFLLEFLNKMEAAPTEKCRVNFEYIAKRD